MAQNGFGMGRNIIQGQRPCTNNRQRPGAASVLCNGTVLLSGGFRPSQMTPELLKHLQNTANR